MKLVASSTRYYNCHRNDNSQWYQEATKEPCKINSMGKAISQQSFYKCQSFDYPDEEHDLTQGHIDCIQTANPMPEDKKYHGDGDNNSFLLTDWLEYTDEHHPVVDICYVKVNQGHFFLGGLKSDCNQFCIGANSHFNNVCIEHLGDYENEMK